MLAEPPTDEQEVARVRDKLQAIAEGRPLAEAAPDVREDTRFFVLGLAPNAARLSIRFWHSETIGAFAERIGQHWRDLQLEPAPWRSPPPVWRLLYETAPQRKAENVPPTLGGALMRAILTGAPYPRSLLAAVVLRIRADKFDEKFFGMRAAICKAVIARNLPLGLLKRRTVPVSAESRGTATTSRITAWAPVRRAYDGLKKVSADRSASTRLSRDQAMPVLHRRRRHYGVSRYLMRELRA